MHLETKYFAYCPDCGERKECTKFKNALRSANAHSKRCRARREQREQKFNKYRLTQYDV